MTSPFDVLARQEDDSSASHHIPIKKIKFENMPKPTNLDPLNPVKFEDKVNELNIKTISTKKTFANILDLNLDKELEEARSDYIEHLVSYNKKIESDKTKYKKLMAGLGVDKEMPAKDEPRELAFSKVKYFEIKEKKKKFLGEGGKMFDLKEASIFEEALEKALSPIVPEKQVKKEPLILKKPKIEEKKENTLTSTANTNVIHIDFEGKKLEIIYTKNSHKVEVLLNDKQIAVGSMTEKGPKIKINPGLKASFLLAPTLEQRAFEKALTHIKTLKF